MLPFFVYGTLLPGQPNYYLLKDVVGSTEAATLSDAILYDTGGAPMLLREAGSNVIGALMTVHDDVYADTLMRLDALEGFRPNAPSDSLYVRERCTVSLTRGAQCDAWVYVGRRQSVIGLKPFGGDWVQYSAEHRSAIDAFWQAYNAKTETDPELIEDPKQP